MPPKTGQELWHWLYGELRAAILDRRLRPGSRVPSSRNLARQYDISRGTVVAAVEHLKHEGYLETQVGAGAFVATVIPDDSTAVVKNRADVGKRTSFAGLSSRGRASAESVPLRPRTPSEKLFGLTNRPSICFPSTCGLGSQEGYCGGLHALCTAKGMQRAISRCGKQLRSTWGERAGSIATSIR
jgi:DNA-binding transcriptional MocR family regulator